VTIVVQLAALIAVFDNCQVLLLEIKQVKYVSLITAIFKLDYVLVFFHRTVSIGIIVRY
jgi:hypothetical protein